MIDFYAYKILQTAQGKMPLEVSFQLEQGNLLTIYGNSGAGKTTLLRILAGLTHSEKSRIVVQGECWDNTETKLHLPTQKRAVGFVFQDFALFPNLTIRENLEYALPNGESNKIIDELLELMQLQSLQKSKPQHISGGQKQRVALARAIVRKPKILLLDEPLSALDDEMREKLQDYILKIHKQFNLTTILVSHHLPEIFKLADKVCLIDSGSIQKMGSPTEVFTDNKISNKFKITGEVLAIEKTDFLYVVQVLVGNSIIKVVATEKEIEGISISSKVIVASKAFNPIIQKIGLK
ncbi:MAG: ATP-binding cassette domain-containing protein [Flavobacteriales bacterium]|nr:ATP-binding cassette domain-containing protein [Flavobacteriales bacterium]